MGEWKRSDGGEEEAEEEPGVSEEKQKPHTKIWGKQNKNNQQPTNF